MNKGAWNVIKTFQANEYATSDYFYVAYPELRMTISYTPSTFSTLTAYLYQQGSSGYSYKTNTELGAAVSYFHSVPSGNYYIDVIAANTGTYTITVEVLAPA